MFVCEISTSKSLLNNLGNSAMKQLLPYNIVLLNVMNKSLMFEGKT